MTELLRQSRERYTPTVEQETGGDFNVEQRPEQLPPPRRETVSRQEVNVSEAANVEMGAVLSDGVLQSLEEALADNLLDVYRGLPPEAQADFKSKGEATAREIRQLMRSGKWRPHKVLKLLREWLNVIPNVNVYFLKQEGKIKFDAVSDIYEAQQSAM